MATTLASSSYARTGPWSVTTAPRESPPATRRAAATLAPEETPTSTPISRARRKTMAWAASVEIAVASSARPGS